MLFATITIQLDIFTLYWIIPLVMNTTADVQGMKQTSNMVAPFTLVLRVQHMYVFLLFQCSDRIGTLNCLF
ncbi:hypothetical protein EG68_02551 [Paragonimus skrjabini miyazakii]|uniref:Uncharacterized protein n=1 Tax=Paragonimus skrjabini miyazakii TaxID=59628 RepID=A0A8S9Z373_9TREM|nr:hypothetical protein EG68_02551 [Paragonimus skrjabini miyazakii]